MSKEKWIYMRDVVRIEMTRLDNIGHMGLTTSEESSVILRL